MHDFQIFWIHSSKRNEIIAIIKTKYYKENLQITSLTVTMVKKCKNGPHFCQNFCEKVPEKNVQEL